MSNYSNYLSHCQEIDEDSPLLSNKYWQMTHRLKDIGRNGKDRGWAVRKLHNEYLALAYDDIDTKKADRLRDCCKYLMFEVSKTTQDKRLAFASSCRVRLCPLCSWRRSLKSYYNTMQVIDEIAHHPGTYGKVRYLFLTLTVRNCQGEELEATLDNLFAGVKRLYQYKDVSKCMLGMVRNLEITHNVNPDSDSYDTYHPHIHCILAVSQNYFARDNYISHDKWVAYWRKAMRLDYDPSVDIRTVKPKQMDDGTVSVSAAVAECSKYAAKDADYVIMDDWDLTVDTVMLLDRVLAKRRLINYSGIMRDVHKLLHLPDPDDDSTDLVNVGAADKLDGDTYMVTYYWYAGYRQYYRVD